MAINRKPFTAYQVLHAWLETQIGSTRSIRPKGYEAPGEGRSTWKETKARAAVLVEGLPMYSICRPHLIEWCQSGLKEVGLVSEFMSSLEDHLVAYPFYASLLDDGSDVTRAPVQYRDVPSVAAELKVSEGYLRKRLCTMPTSLPFGSFNDRRVWKIHPLDVPELKKYFDGAKRVGFR